MAITTQTSRVGANAINDHFSKFFSGMGTWDAGSVAQAAEAVDTITIVGVALGDIVLGVSFSVSAADLVVTGFVSAADTVTVSIANNTGGAIDLASAVVRVVVGRLAAFPSTTTL